MTGDAWATATSNTTACALASGYFPEWVIQPLSATCLAQVGLRGLTLLRANLVQIHSPAGHPDPIRLTLVRFVPLGPPGREVSWPLNTRRLSANFTAACASAPRCICR